jgi:two-component system, cell cycle response regulator
LGEFCEAAPVTVPLRVLVVDDDNDILVMLQTVLRRDYDVLTATDGVAALKLIEHNDVAAVLADHMMPGMTGVELLDRAHALRPGAARVLITASDRIAVLKDAINQARVHRFLSKPLRLTELPGLVSGAIREVKLETENVRLVEELSLKNAELARNNEQLESQVLERTRELRAAVAELEQLALRDGLTGLFNHRYFQECLEAELSRARRQNEPLGLLFIDVDHFKQYNDRNGHPAGDRLLKRLASVLLGGGESGKPRMARLSDTVARYGGEEFVMILPATATEGCLARAGRLLRSIAEQPFEAHELQPGGQVSVSIGVACFPLHAQDKQALIAAADAMLYRAKREGRNRVCSPPSAAAQSDPD